MKRFRKLIGSFLLMGFMLPLCMDGRAEAAGGAWRRSAKGYWYEYSDGTYAKNTWVEYNKKWYYFNAAGYMVTGWQAVGKNWYYLDETTGAMVTGWREVDGEWYWFSSSGVMQKGWKKLSNKWYYFGTKGAMATGWNKIGGKWYYFLSEGFMADGWRKIDGSWYYLGTDGAMVTGWKELDNNWYFFDNGAMVTGIRPIGGVVYIFDKNGALLDKENEDGYMIHNGTLYVTRIDYSIEHVTGKDVYVYKTPWTSSGNEKYTRIVANAGLNCIRDEGQVKTEVRNLTLGPFGAESNIISADINLYMNGVMDASFLLSGCESLEHATVSLSGSSVRYAAFMFAADKKLKTVSLSISSGQIEEVQRMFYECESLYSANTSFTGPMKRCGEMYYGCSSITNVSVPFNIEKDTSFSGMFYHCNNLSQVNFSGVSVENGGQSFFNNENSITSYVFTENWNVASDEIDPIGDSFVDIHIIPIPKTQGGTMMLEVFDYSKPRPDWYRDFIEYYYQVGDWLRIYSSPIRDVYLSTGEFDPGASEESVILDMLYNALQTAIEEYAGDDDETLKIMKSVYDILG